MPHPINTVTLTDNAEFEDAWTLALDQGRIQPGLRTHMETWVRQKPDDAVRFLQDLPFREAKPAGRPGDSSPGKSNPVQRGSSTTGSFRSRRRRYGNRRHLRRPTERL